ncbi:AMP-binding protein [Streptomyces griseus]|uniref:AMP-binding protein n=2 Tax=Streptomyces TaxID=1883 RepID=A0ABU2W4X2_9ACTN|nr:SDR family oxidoreductase [Streptomyces griseus]MDT0492177.1 AMP-binding protein [Streptomyces griseus]
MTEHQAPHDIASRIAALHAGDPEFARAVPSPDVADAIGRQDGLTGAIAAAMHGYADRPALARRSYRLVRDPATGRRTRELLPVFETLTYAELWQRVGRLAAAWAHGGDGPRAEGTGGPRAGGARGADGLHAERAHGASGLRAEEFVATLGFTGVDYAVIDLACMYLGAVSVPLPTGSSAERLAPVVAETGPRILAADTGSLDAAVGAVLASDSIERLVVFDYDPQVDGEREAFEAAVAALAGRAEVVPLADEVDRGTRLPGVDPYEDGDPDRLAGLIYTSGSTGTPKGAIFTAAMLTRMWQNARGGLNAGGGSGTPVFVLHFMPMSHVNGRAWLVNGLAAGGTGYFAARGDMSTLFEDIRLARPTVLSLVPRICDMVYQRHQLEADRIGRTGTPRPEAEAAASALVRDSLLGGRIVFALCGSAPLSEAMHTFTAALLGTPVIDCYGSTETTRAIVVDQQIRRPPVTGYRLADVPELGYFSTDKPYPRGELRVKSVGLFPGYYRQPETTARAFDEDGYYRTGDVFAETAPGRLVYVDRTNNVVKLSQGEFIAVSGLEALYTTSPYIAQIYVYGSGEQAFPLAVVVPDAERLGEADDDTVRAAVLDSLRELAHGAGLNAYEIPHDVLVERQPFTLTNGLLSGVGKLLRPVLKERYGPRLERLYADIASGRAGRIAALRAAGREVTPLEAVRTAAQITLGCPASLVRDEAAFTDLGGDSLSAHTFSTVLEQILDEEVPIQVILQPSSTLARMADWLGAARAAREPRPTFASVHGAGAHEVRAADLTLDRFVAPRLLTAGRGARRAPADVRNVLLTGATGYLGRFLAVERLRRAEETGGRLTCLVRAADDGAARQRVRECLRAASADGTDRTDGTDPVVRAEASGTDRTDRTDRTHGADWFDTVAEKHLTVLAADLSAPRLGLAEAVWEELAEQTDQIVHAAALVNHVLPYQRLFAPNVVATAELIELALTGRAKRFAQVSTVAAALLPDGSFLDESADIRTAYPVRSLDGSDANGYATSKWAGEVLLREAHERTGLPVTVFRPDMVLAHRTLPGELNLTDRFSRLLLTVLTTGMAPRSFYELDRDGGRQRAHYSGLPVDFTAAAITALSAEDGSGDDGYVTYNTVNAHDDGISWDAFVDWLIDAGHPITRFDDHRQWHMRTEAALRGLPDHQRRLSLLPLMRAYARPGAPRPGSAVPAARFSTAVGTSGAGGAEGGVPSLTPAFIAKCVADLRRHGLL